RAGDEPLEPRKVDLLRGDLKRVARPAGEEPLTPEQLAQLGDIDVNCRRRRRWGVLAPERVDEPVDRHGAIRVEEQHGEQGALLRTTESDGTSVAAHLERSENPELHRLPLDCPTGDPLCPGSPTNRWRGSRK